MRDATVESFAPRGRRHDIRDAVLGLRRGVEGVPAMLLRCQNSLIADAEFFAKSFDRRPSPHDKGTASLLRQLAKELAVTGAHLRLVLPMAKAWAAAHPVGSNAQIVADAEATIGAAQQDG